MWQEYLGLAGVAIAVLNGILAIAIALLPARRSVYKLRLGAVAGALAVLAVGITAYSRYQAAAEAAQRQGEQASIGQQLLVFITEGRTLLAQIKHSRRELPARSADEWAQRAESFLRDKLGDAYVTRFRSAASGIYGDDLTVLPSRLLYWRAVRNRVVNLEMINAEFGGRPAEASAPSAAGAALRPNSPAAAGDASASP